MDFSHVTTRRPTFACAALVMTLAGCSGLSERPAEGPLIYYDAGDSWTTPKRNVHMYQCRNSAMTCTGPASYLNVTYTCRCE
jgi:hypothetical protein